MKMSQPNSSLTQKQLEQAIAAQESLRGALDDAIIDATIDLLRAHMTELRTTSDDSEQQRKLVTVLFADVVGSTALLGGLDPEENMAVMDSALQRLAAPVNAYGGRVTRYMGDGFLAVFGLPRARENDPEMAVRAGLGITQTARDIALDLETEWAIRGFQIRVGVSTGLVMTGGFTEAEDTIMGATVNLAARLEHSAPPDVVLISQETYQHVRGIFDLEIGEEIEAKGFSEPVQVYVVKRAKPRAFRMRTRGVEGVNTRMVGRDEELRQLHESFEAVKRRRQNRFILVVGDAGLGKSRLLQEFESELEPVSASATLLKGRATLETLNLPYGLFRDLLADYFAILEDDSLAIVKTKIASGFKDALGEAADPVLKAHFVGQLLGYDFRDSPYLQHVLDTPQQLRNRALVYLIEYFRSLAIHNPVTIFLDDIHWADESSLDSLLRLSLELSNEQILIVALTRPILFERRPAWEDQNSFLQLALNPLSREQSGLLVEEVLQKAQDIPDRLRELLVSHAEGNPFYLEELIRMLVDDGVIVESGPVWQVHQERLSNVRVPPTLTGVIQARLDGLSAMERTILQQASVIGRVFWDAAIGYLNQDDTSGPADSRPASLDIARDLDLLQQRKMILHRDVSAFSDTAEYFFKHTILQDVTYESVLLRVRKVYHGMVADWLIAHIGERAEELTGLIAGHLEKAGRNDEALGYLRRAAEAAASKYANDEAAGFYARALALTPDEDLEGRYTLLCGQERVFSFQGNRTAQQEAITSLQKLVNESTDTQKAVEVLLRRVWFAYWAGDFPEAQEAAQEAVTIAKTIEDQRLLGQASYASAWAYLQVGNFDSALACASDALLWARQVKDHRVEGNTLNTLGMINIARGEYAAARGYLEGFLETSRELGDLEREVAALTNLGVVNTLMGNYPAARDYFMQASSLLAVTGNRVLQSSTTINLAWVSSASEDWEAAREYAEAGVAKKREFGHAEGMAEGLIWLGHAWLGLGQPGNAISAYSEALAIRRELAQLHLAMEALAGMARAAQAKDDLDAAKGYVEEILTYLADDGSLQGTWEPLRIFLTCFQTLDACGDPRAQSALDKAHTELVELAARIPDKGDRDRFLGNVPWHRAIETAWNTGQENR